MADEPAAVQIVSADPAKPPKDWAVHPKVGGALVGGYVGTLIIGLIEDISNQTVSDKTAGAILGLSTFLVAYLFPSAAQ